MSYQSSDDRKPSHTVRNTVGALALVAAIGGGVAAKSTRNNRLEAESHENLDPTQQPAAYDTAPSRQRLGQIVRGELENRNPLEPEVQAVADSLIVVNRALNECVDAYTGLAASFRSLCVRNPDCMNQLVATDEATIDRFRASTTLPTTMASQLQPEYITDRSVDSLQTDRASVPLSMIDEVRFVNVDLQTVIRGIQSQQARLRECQAFSGTLGAAVERLRNNEPVVPPPPAVDAGSGDAATDADDATPNTDPNSVYVGGRQETAL